MRQDLDSGLGSRSFLAGAANPSEIVGEFVCLCWVCAFFWLEGLLLSSVLQEFCHSKLI